MSNTRPGKWYLSGSIMFSAQNGIRESLTGRIGLIHLYPLSLSEVKSTPLLELNKQLMPSHSRLRFSSSDLAKQMELGGLPVPAFIRDQAIRKQYFQSWLETTIVRDVQKVYGKNYDADFCMSIIRQFTNACLQGDYPSLQYLVNPRKSKKYIEALEHVFLIRKISIHELGVGKNHWFFSDAGLLYFLMQEVRNQNTTLALVRHYILNEVFSLYEYNGNPLPKLYYKSPKGSVVDFLIKNIPFQIICETISTSQIPQKSRALQGAMEKLNSKQGFIVAPVDFIHMPKIGVGILPWSFWS